MSRWLTPLLTLGLLMATPGWSRAQGYPPPTPINPARYPLPAENPPQQPVITTNTGLPKFQFNSAPAPTAQPTASTPFAPPPMATPAGRYPLQPTAPAPAPPVKSPTAVVQQPATTSAAPEPAPPATDLFEAGQIVAMVGNQYILYGDVAPTVNQYLGPALAKAQSQAEREQIEKARDQLVQQVIKQVVDNKLLYIEFEREIEKNAGRDKLAEARTKMQESVREKFEEQLATAREKVRTGTVKDVQDFAKQDPNIARLAVMMRDNNIETLADLDTLLRQHDTSLEKQRRAWGEYMIGRMSISQKLKKLPEVTHQEMLDYYNEQRDEYQLQAKARFEILTVKFSSYRTPDEARQAIAAMGNEVFFGAPFAAVAKKHSQEPNARSGGYYDWTTQGSLASEPIDRAIFSIETGKLSEIIQDAVGLHIVRVIERQEAGERSFVDVQTEIKEAINNQNREKQIKEYVEELRKKTLVRTIYDPPAQVAEQNDPAQATTPR